MDKLQELLGYTKNTLEGLLGIEKPKLEDLLGIYNSTPAMIQPTAKALQAPLTQEGQQYASNLAKKNTNKLVTPLLPMKDGTGFSVQTPSGKYIKTDVSSAVGSLKNIRKLAKLDPLIQEAKKYKSAEEFVEAHGEILYHGTTEKNLSHLDINKSNNGNLGKGIYITDNNMVAKQYGKIAQESKMLKSRNYTGEIPEGNIIEVSLKKDAKIKKLNHQPTYKEAQKIKNEGYDGINYPDESMQIYEGGKRILEDSRATVIYNPKIIKTKSQLTDIWNKANKK